MPFTPKRPLALIHLSDEAASAMLAKHVGDVAKAARELGVDRKDLRRLIWHNPNILNAAHERMGLFRIGVKSKIIEAVYSRSAKRRRWGYDAMFDSYEFRDSLFASAKWFASAQRESAAKDVLVWEREQTAAAEFEREAAAELEQEAAAELAHERALEREADRRRESEPVVAEVACPRKAPLALLAQGGSLWPAGVRRPSRGGWR
jgi:hypothetical protein